VLAAVTAELGADWLDVMVLWMREIGLGLNTVFTVFFVIACTPLAIPISLQAMGIGYFWTWAYGGTVGVGISGCVLMLGALIASAFMYVAGKGFLAERFSVNSPSTFMGRMCDSMGHVPLHLLLLLRLFPMTNFAFLGYWAGGSDRFTFKQAMCSLFAWWPLGYLYVGIGGAIVKLHLVQRGEASSDDYLPWIWAMFSVAIFFLLVSFGFAYMAYKKERGGGQPKRKSSSRGTAAVNLTIASSSADLDKAESYTVMNMQGDNDQPPPPLAPPPPEDLPPGWREVLSDDGELYYFNDDSGESSWDKPNPDGSIPASTTELGMAD